MCVFNGRWSKKFAYVLSSANSACKHPFFLEKGVKQAGINSIIRTYVYSLYLNYIYVDLFVTLFSFERMEAFINLEVTG